MSISEYHFVMTTPNGIRIANIIFDYERDGKLCGYIELPQFKNNFSMVIHNDGTLSVKFDKSDTSFFSELTGTGKISFHAISMSIASDCFVYEINGTAVRV